MMRNTIGSRLAIAATWLVLASMLGSGVGCRFETRRMDGDLVFLGTVVRLYPSPLPQSTLNWVAEFQLDTLLSGTFSGKSFSFRLHSPSRSGLEVGGQYRVVAKRTPGGYTVDPFGGIEKVKE